ncbi:response regulator [Pseudomonas panipatensis]|uniref:DNA-binding response regulator, NarL/FixJ family, contains REC and HTH domains n=1 Tax=Pseudomonas panipatensis TaxID=428992 RepID=A0A1G8E0Q0_9PSED|nr:response regulator transcription factor [Pseudomonas panipatensis]SDH63437.1 DNA-binding response regulator, NarL/FixJ family, contains REC and HTH domains [Pseudomonas panipatensis]SMP38928.1 two component transcriptional regulator, LuxR family [Pseudomonas panipatensis]
MDSVIRIGIVDDHPLLREGVANALRKRADFKVLEQGANADEAKSIAMRLQPDVLLMDVNMPGDPFSAVRFIATEHPQVKVLMLTVSESEEDAYCALEAGARGYLLKGISGPDLVTAIRNVARGDIHITPEFERKLLSNFKRREIEIKKIDLTHREEQVIREVSKGLTNKEVAEKLAISEKTVKYYMTCVMQKLHARNRVEAVTALRRYWESENLGRIGPSPQFNHLKEF